jgi:DNA-binding response OmpR family regulator
MGHGRTVLVVDDDRAMSQVVALALQDEGFVVEVADDGRAAIGLAARLKPDMVILDLMLPGISGAGVAEALRSTQGDGLPVVLMSGSPGAATIARKIGANGFLAKPFELEALITAARRCLPPLVAGGTAHPVLAWARLLREQIAQHRATNRARRADVAAGQRRLARIREQTWALLSAV